MRNSLVIAVASAAIILLSATIHGKLTDRWGLATELQTAANRLEQLPNQLGEWASEPVVLDKNSLEVANVAGYFCRRYVHKYSREEVTLLIACGRPGQAAAHPPEVCYSASGYDVGSKRTRDLAAFGSAWEADFTRTGRGNDGLRIVWAWSDDGNWSASSSPRVQFARSGYLYKMYLIRRTTTPAADTTALASFLDLILPECQKHLSLTGVHS